MSIDLTGITNKNEYYTNHYFATVFEENASSTISGWNAASKEAEEFRTPWSLLRQNARQYYAAHDRFVRSSMNLHALSNIRALADSYLASLGYPEAKPEVITVNDALTVPVYLEMTKSNGAPLLWVILSASKESDTGIMESYAFHSADVEEDANGALYKGILNEMSNEDLATKILFGSAEPPRFLLFISMNQIALIDRSKWNEKRYLQFELEEIFSRLENTTLQAMAVLLHRDSLCPEDGKILLDELDEQSQKNASGVSQKLKYALRESIEMLGNEVLYDMAHRLGRDLEADPVDAGKLTLECLRYMYRMLFVLFIESRPELGYAPIKAQTYYSGYSLESLRDIADNIRDDVAEVGNGYYLHDTLAKLYELIYDGYPKTEEELRRAAGSDSLHDMFLIAPLKAHIFDPKYTEMITAARLRNSCMLRIIDLMSLTKSTGKKNDRRGRISYANLGINQMGAVYEALLSYRGFIAERDLYEVKRAGDSFNELDVGYFVSEAELDQYTEDERVRYETGGKKGKLRMYEKGTFIYRLAGREREKSASYYTPEVLTKCLVKYALKELLEGKTADDILKLTICEPAMGSAAFLNEAIDQLAEAYISRKEKETGDIISYEKRFNEQQKVKMYIADRNVYGIDLNSVAVELAEVSLWLNTIYEGGFVPWFGSQLVNGNSLIGARRQVYSEVSLQATSKGMRWYENEPERVLLGTERKKKKGFAQIYHFLLGDPGMCGYSDKVIKSLEPDNIKKMGKWSKKFTEPLSDDDLVTLRRLSDVIDELWSKQIELQREIEAKTQDNLSVYGHEDTSVDSHTTIREKDKIFSELYKSEHMKNAGPYARLKFAMDYWCALWFWPIEQADLLPSRSEFLFDMSLILEGTTRSVLVTDASTDKKQTRGQLTLFPTEMQQLEMNILALYDGIGEVDIPALRRENPRLNLAYEIAEQNKFMHWELEFAKLFAERGGFDLVIGNPPWIKAKWDEQSVLADFNPLFTIRVFPVNKKNLIRANTLKHKDVLCLYLTEYTQAAGTLNYMNAIENYPELQGVQTNHYKCFLPQAWKICGDAGVFAFIHPDGVFDDSKGDNLRRLFYPRLKKHFHFVNERLLFQEIGHPEVFSLNVYSNVASDTFESISNLFDPKTIDECYCNSDVEKVPGIKDENGEWNIIGHPDRVIKITKNELKMFAKIFDDSEEYKGARLPVVHAKQLLRVLSTFSKHSNIQSLQNGYYATQMFDETGAQNAHIISPDVHFTDKSEDMIYSGPHVGVANPYNQTPRANCSSKGDNDKLDLLFLPDDYLARSKYRISCTLSEYVATIPSTPWNSKYNMEYKLLSRKMLNLKQERTLMSAIAPPKTGHINGIYGLCFADSDILALLSGCFASLPYDFFIKCLGKTNFLDNTAGKMPILDSKYAKAIKLRSLLLNCLSSKYSALWKKCWCDDFMTYSWSINDERLDNVRFTHLAAEWTHETPLRTDFERRMALIELDVLVAKALGLTLNELKTIYRIQFPVLQQYEMDTWYDKNGRIVFTNNRGLSGVGVDRKTWENVVVDMSVGQVYSQKTIDCTMPGGPVERTIEYVAPFDRCDREQDYETAWKFFEEKYGK